MQTEKSETWVGISLLVTLLAALFIYLGVANVVSVRIEPTYTLYMTFGNIGGLKTRSPISIDGAVVDQVADITLNPETYLPHVTLEIRQRYNHIPDINSLNTRTSDLLGGQYLILNVGFEGPEPRTVILKDDDTIQGAKSAMVLEDLIGQFLYGSRDGDSKNSGDAPAAASGNNGTTEPAGTTK